MDIFQLPGILLKRWIYVLIPVVLFVGLASFYVVVTKPTIAVTADLLLDPQGLVAAPESLVPQPGGNTQDQGVLESQIFVMQSSEILDSVVDKLNLTRDPFLYRGPTDNKELARLATVGAIQKHLSVERAGQSFIVTMTFKHVDPAKGAEILNAIANTYLKKVHEARNDASSRASGAFEQQANTLASRVRNAETELEAFKAQHGIVSTGQQGLVIDQQVEGVNKQLIAARADLGSKRASYLQAQSLTVGSVQDGAIPEALASTALGSMRARYADLAASANELSSQLGANHPQMKAARSQLAGMRESIEQELARIRTSLRSSVERSESSVKALEQRLGELTKSSIDTSEAGIKARELQSEVDTLRALYKALLSRSEELGQRDTVNVNNSRIISKAVGIGSASPVAKIIIMIAAILFGIAAGCGLAVLRESLSRMFVRPVAKVNKEPEQEPEHVAAPETETYAAPRTQVIAHMPAQRAASAASAAVRFANASSRLSSSRDSRLAGVSMTVDRILNMRRQPGMSTIVLLSPGNDNPGRDLSRDIADALYRHEKDVFFSTGEGINGDERSVYSDLPLGDILKFQRLAPISPRSEERAGPTFRHFAERLRKPDYVIIDARGHEARRHLEELLPQASGILVLASDLDGQKKIDGFLKTLAPFEDRMLGTIMFDRAA